MMVLSWLLLAPFLFDGCLGRSQGAVVGGQEGGPSQGPAGSLEMKVPQDAVKHETEHMDHMEGRLLNFFLDSFSNDQKALKKENNAMKVEEDSAEGQTDSAKEHMEVGEFLKQTEHLEVYKNLAAMATEAPAMEMEMTTVKTVKKSGSMLGQIVMRARKDQGRPKRVEQEKKTGGMGDLEDKKDNVTKYDEGEKNHKQLENMGDYTENIYIKNIKSSEEGKHGNISNEDVEIIVETKTLTGREVVPEEDSLLPSSPLDMSPPYTYVSPTSSDNSALATDMSPRFTDMSALSTDVSAPSNDMSHPSADMSALSTDISAPSTDMSTPSTDMSAPSTDMSLPSTDISAHSTDMSAPSTDMSPPSTTSSPLLVDSLAQLFPVSPEAQTEDPDTLEDRSDEDERRSSCRAGERGGCGGTQDGEDAGDNSIQKQPLIFPTGAIKETSEYPKDIFEAEEVTVEAEEVTTEAVKENHGILQRVINFFY